MNNNIIDLENEHNSAKIIASRLFEHNLDENNYFAILMKECNIDDAAIFILEVVLYGISILSNDMITIFDIDNVDNEFIGKINKYLNKIHFMMKIIKINEINDSYLSEIISIEDAMKFGKKEYYSILSYLISYNDDYVVPQKLNDVKIIFKAKNDDYFQVSFEHLDYISV